MNLLLLFMDSNLLSLDKSLIWHPYTQEKNAPGNVLITKGEGAYLIDNAGNRYFDATSSWWTNIHGHAHPHIAQKLFEQASTLEHVIFAGNTHEPAIRLAEKLKTYLPNNQQKFFFSDNGSTAVEAALKMAFQYWFNRDEKRTKVLAFEGAYHGDTFGSMSVSARGLFTNPFKPLLFDILTIPVPTENNITEVLALVDQWVQEHAIASFIYEPLVQGANGMIIYDAAHLELILQKLKSVNVLLIADEVMTGFGRTGKMFACEYMNTEPDIMCFSKGLTAGAMPMGLTSCAQSIYDAFYDDNKEKTFFHGHSSTGNPLGCAVALASLELFDTEKTLDNVAMITTWNKKAVASLQQNKAFENIATLGTVLRFDIKTNESTSYLNAVKLRCMEFFKAQNILIRPLGNVLYFLPPYCTTEAELDYLLQTALDFGDTL
ncbi:MAG: adenosylmethionine--8-amino-7-oxononanoate transaminase [Chitinophagales bacterium]